MFRFFTKKKDVPRQEIQVDLPQAILKNKTAIETLEKRRLHLEKRIKLQSDEAVSRSQAGDKRGALFALKKKKLLETELERLSNAHLTLEQQIMTLESAQSQQVAVGALAAGVTAQKILNQQMNISKLDDLIEDMQEQAGLQNEVAQILTDGAGHLDEDELLAELNQLEMKQIEDKLIDKLPLPEESLGMPIPVKTSSPSTLSSPIKTNDDPFAVKKKPMTEEDELKLLMSEFN